jgi:DNA ligase (NAD+)
MKILAAKTPQVAVDKLALRVKKARVAYGRGLPIMTDKAYDALEDELRSADPGHPLLTHSGSDVPTKMKVELPHPMPSLDKRKYGKGAVGPWLEAHPGPYVISWKADGISALDDDKPSEGVRLYTRGKSGDGMGGDITYLVPHLKKLPRTGKRAVVRGELIMHNATFSKKWKAEYENARNLAAGVTNRTTVHPAAADIDFMAYELLVPRLKPSEAFALLKSWGFHVAPYKVVKSLTEEQLLVLLKTARANTSYDVDGLVIEQDIKTSIQDSNPEHKFAFKSDTEDAAGETRVLRVEWNLTRTGIFFPRLIVSPLRLGGVTVNHASGKSADFIRDNGIGPGAVIRLRRSGDVIPDLMPVDVIKRAKVVYPDVPYEWKGANLVPPTKTAVSVEQTVMRLTHFFVTLGVERFKDSTVAKYVDAGFNTPRKIINMSQTQFTTVEGVSTTSRVIYEQVQSLKAGVEMHLLMYAWGGFGRSFGSRKCAAIIKAHPNILDYAGNGVTTLVPLIDDVPGFDVKQATVFAKGLPAFAKFVLALKLPLLKPKVIKVRGSKCAGMAVLFTGVRDDELSKLIVQNGGTIAPSPTTATVLLAKDPGGDSAKLNAARAKGIPIMTLQAFRKRYGL